MRVLQFITGHVIYNPAYTYNFQLKTTHLTSFHNVFDDFLQKLPQYACLLPPSSSPQGIILVACCRIAMNRASRFPAVLFKKRNIFLGGSKVGHVSRKASKDFYKKKMRERSSSFVNSNEKMLALMDRAPFFGGCKTRVSRSGPNCRIDFSLKFGINGFV